MNMEFLIRLYCLRLIILMKLTKIYAIICSKIRWTLLQLMIMNP